MSDDNVIEIETDDSAVEAEKILNESKTFKIAIVGNPDSDLTKASRILYSSNRQLTEVKVLSVDDVKDFDPDLSVVCTNISMSKNDVVDDAELIDTIKKLFLISTGICLKTTVPLDTFSNVLLCAPEEIVARRLIYSPEIEISLNDILNCPVSLVGAGDADTVDENARILRNLTIDSRPKVFSGKWFDIAMAKLAIAGQRAVHQEYYNQLWEFCGEHNQFVTYGIIRNILNEVDDISKNRMYSVPVSLRSGNLGADLEKDVKQKGEYENLDVRLLSNISDKFTLVDEAINTKNLR